MTLQLVLYTSFHADSYWTLSGPHLSTISTEVLLRESTYYRYVSDANIETKNYNNLIVYHDKDIEVHLSLSLEKLTDHKMMTLSVKPY